MTETQAITVATDYHDAHTPEEHGMNQNLADHLRADGLTVHDPVTDIIDSIADYLDHQDPARDRDDLQEEAHTIALRWIA